MEQKNKVEYGTAILDIVSRQKCNGSIDNVLYSAQLLSLCTYVCTG
jgi:hypothetical protein